VTVLLDANVLIALVTPEHTHNEAAEGWLAALHETFATSPVTQGALVRALVRYGAAPGNAVAILTDLVGDHRHRFWPDSIGYDAVSFDGVVGHRQVTDAYLAGLTRANGGSLATFDRGLAALHPDVAQLVPTS